MGYRWARMWAGVWSNRWDLHLHTIAIAIANVNAIGKCKWKMPYRSIKMPKPINYVCESRSSLPLIAGHYDGNYNLSQFVIYFVFFRHHEYWHRSTEMG